MVNEIRRILRKEPLDNHYDYATQCVSRLQYHLEKLIFFGVSRVGKPPISNELGEKLCYLMENIDQIFNKKKSGKNLFIEIDDNEDPEIARSKIRSSCPVLMVEKRSKATLIINKSAIFVSVNLDLAIVAFLGSYYILNRDYPQELEVVLTLFQILIFEDYSAPARCLKQANTILTKYNAFLGH
ncbi:uncharacterized protein [Clytia hemisphaerica]|uniref:uncharacterized protein n=1 Tax=Clytia hemisphaerica TaxID=252671 RepID=UPI0034D697E6